jgi:hypothetical protein
MREVICSIRKQSFGIRIVETRNRLPDRVKLTEKPESFMKELGTDSKRTDGEEA